MVEHLAAGLTGHEIAGCPAISPRTAGEHLEHIYAKLNVISRATLVAAFHRHHEAHA